MSLTSIENQNIIKGTSVNVSLDGICGAFEGKFNKGEKVNIDLMFKIDNKDVKCSGEVLIAWALDVGNDEFLIGMSLLGYDKNNMSLYSEYVNKLMRDNSVME